MAGSAAATPTRAASPDVLKKKGVAEERRKSIKGQQGLSPRAEAAFQAKAAKAYMGHLRAVESAAAKHFAARGPPTEIGTNAEDLAWLENNKNAPGVVVLPCGLQYKVLKSAKSGAKSPKVDTPCDVHYRGKLLGSGAEFYCSYAKTAEPERHVANRIIQGWTVALQLMGVGDKWMLFVPSELGYGDAGSTNGWKNIPPHAALIFELELCAVRSEAAPPKVHRPPGMSTEELIELAATVVPTKPLGSPAPTLMPTGAEENASINGTEDPPITMGGLFDRSATPKVAHRRPLSARRGADGGGGSCAPGGGAGSVEALRALLADAEQSAAESTARADALAVENEQLRATLDKAVERALQWQAQAKAVQAQLEGFEAEAEALQTQLEALESSRAGSSRRSVEVELPGALPTSPELRRGLEPIPSALETALETALDAPSRVVVLVGVTGGGKSSVGCVLAASSSAFGVSSGFSSATLLPAHADYTSIPHADPHAVRATTRVIDTVGFHDTTAPAAVAMRRFSAFEQLLPAEGGVDLFLFVLPYGRFSSAAEAALDAFVACCGEAALEHTVLVFTRCRLSYDELKAELMRSAPPSLRRIIPRLAFPSVLGVDVLAQPIASRDMLRTGVDEAIAGLEGQRYSRPALADAIEEYGGGQDEKERAAFAAAVSDWRKGGEDASQ